MAHPLPFSIAALSSEDAAHPARELRAFHSHSRGWQSERWCDFPQYLILKFDELVSIQQACESATPHALEVFARHRMRSDGWTLDCA